MKTHKLNFLFSLVLLIACGVDAEWRVPLPPNTSITLPLRSIVVKGIKMPLPGDESTDTLIEVGTERFISINTNGVVGTVQIMASLQIAVPRASVEAITGMSTTLAPHGANTNAVSQVAFGKLMQTLPVIAEELSQ